eukprot:PhF_6_TR40827/c1_g2_i1/m.61789
MGNTAANPKVSVNELLSLIKPNDTTSSFRYQSSHVLRLPRDCRNRILTYCETTAQSNVYLVCRSWYDAVDRNVCLMDRVYYFPESFIPIPNKIQWFPSDRLHLLQQRHEELWGLIQIVCIKVTASLDSVTLPPLTKKLQINLTCGYGLPLSTMLSSCKQIQNVFVFVTGTGSSSPVDIVGLENIPTLEYLGLSCTRVSDVSHLSSCRALNMFAVSDCPALTDAGIRGLENISTLRFINLSRT